MSQTLRDLRPRYSYIVCATARSGSTLLCQALAETGLAGRPEEYFEARRDTGAPPRAIDFLADAPATVRAEVEDVPPPGPPHYSSLRGVADYRDHLRRTLRRGTGPNGVFGAKLMWMHVDQLLPLLRTLPELRGATLAQALETLLPGVRYAWVRREDPVRQAVSLWRALQTQAWRAGEGPERPPAPEYSFPALRYVCERLRADDAAWGRWFKRERLRPVELRYEQISRDLPAVVETVLRHVGVDVSGLSPPRARTARQADRLSELWVERYERDLARVPASAR